LTLSAGGCRIGVVRPGRSRGRGRSRPTPEEIKLLARRYIEDVVNRGDVGAIGEFFADNPVLRCSQMPDIRDRETLKQVTTMVRTAFPDLHIAVEDAIAEGDKVVLRWTLTGTQRGEFMGIAPTGRTVSVSGINIFRVAGGRIAEQWEELDLAGIFQQLGAFPGQVQAQGRSGG
jgi:steroid delta-isomerase-like uncharacterized protein